MFKDYFGIRVKKENEWVKSVDNLENLNPKDYFGITASNGVIGAVSSIKPINVATTVLAGAYDVFGRGRVDNIVETFPALQLAVYFGGSEITGGGYYNYEQGLNFKLGEFSGAFSS
jgi:protein-glucosylgalactosylhydroxylysine glucosidase